MNGTGTGFKSIHGNLRSTWKSFNQLNLHRLIHEPVFITVKKVKKCKKSKTKEMVGDNFG
ncbi:MAG: hypothetical protein Kow00111_05780 [Thermincola ferriacetica]